MKTCSKFPRNKAVLAASVVFASFAAPRAEAIAVDNELVVLVDAYAGQDLSFDTVLDGIAQSFERQSFVDSVVSGPNGRIAATVVFFNSNTQTGLTEGIPWMELSSSADLLNFASTIRTLTGAVLGNVNYSNAISEGAALIAGSGNEGTLGQLTFIDDGTGFFSQEPAAARTARDAALSSSVDVINAVVYDTQDTLSTIETYYNDNIVGGAGGTLATVNSPTVPLPNGLTGALDGSVAGKSEASEAAIADSIANAVTSPTIAAAAVPEPSSFLLLAASGFGFLIRRKR